MDSAQILTLTAYFMLCNPRDYKIKSIKVRNICYCPLTALQNLLVPRSAGGIIFYRYYLPSRPNSWETGWKLVISPVSN